jgi:cell wall-associated NlpC family hydrolase
MPEMKPLPRQLRRACVGLISAVLIAGCATSPAPTAPPALKPIAARLTVEQANEVTVMAIGLVGTPYRYGGNTPASGFDCSGLIGYVYKARGGVLAPRSVSALVKWGSPVPADSVRTGDLVIFSQGGNATHAGIYVGDGRFVHAPSTGGEVRLDQLKSKYWSQQQVAFRRP